MTMTFCDTRAVTSILAIIDQVKKGISMLAIRKVVIDIICQCFVVFLFYKIESN